MKTMTISDLFARRAELLEELDRINSAIELQKDGASSVKIWTRRNLRNSYLAGVDVYQDEDLTEIASESNHGGFVPKASLAQLRIEAGDDENELWGVDED